MPGHKLFMKDLQKKNVPKSSKKEVVETKQNTGFINFADLEWRIICSPYYCQSVCLKKRKLKFECQDQNDLDKAAVVMTMQTVGLSLD
jgi:hypothetical protein